MGLTKLASVSFKTKGHFTRYDAYGLSRAIDQPFTFWIKAGVQVKMTLGANEIMQALLLPMPTTKTMFADLEKL